MRSVRCPQCGADLKPPASVGPAVETCAYCRTVVVHGVTVRVAGRAVGDEAGRLTPETWTRALTCRLCGAPLPDAATRADPQNVRCAYCGHRARLAPGILAVLRVALTRPRALPPRLRRSLLLWAAVWAVGLFAVLPLAIWRVDRSERLAVAVEARPEPALVRQSFEMPRHTDGEVQLVYGLAEETDVPVCVAVRLQRGDRGYRDVRVLRADHRQRLERLHAVAPGAYEVLVRATAREPATVRVELHASGALSLGWILATLLLLYLGMMLELTRAAFDRPAGVRRWIGRGLAAAWLGVLLVIAATRWDPLGEDFHPRPLGPLTDCAAAPAETTGEG